MSGGSEDPRAVPEDGAADAHGCAPASTGGCTGCADVVNRRAFLREGAAAGLAVLGLLPGLGASGASLPVGWSNALRRSGGQIEMALPAEDGVLIERTSEIILVRREGLVYAFALSCPHQHTMLRWLEQDQRFQCPKHKSKYGPDGAYLSGRATRSMDRYAVKVAGTTAVIDMSHAFRQDVDPNGWNAAFAHV